MNKARIEYLDQSWNPIAMRCTPVSEGCAHCWHLRMADRMAANPASPDNVRAAYAGEGSPVLIEERLREPLRRKKPTVIGVQFMGDLFHEDVPDGFILQVFDIMSITPQHTYLILTKRPLFMLDWYKKMTVEGYLAVMEPDGRIDDNVWLGVTAENQKCADERIPILLQIPAAVRFLSCEPMLGPINLRPYLKTIIVDGEKFHKTWPDIHWLDWVIVGGESGPCARPTHPQWVRDIRDQCVSAETKFFFKQWGEWAPLSALPVEYLPPRGIEYTWPDAKEVYKVGRGFAGGLLDGEEWNQMPNRICNGESFMDSVSVA